MNNITFTASPMSKPDDLSRKESLAWDYFFDKGSWFCTETMDGNIIVSEESLDLRNAFVFSDYDAFLEWLESDATDKLAEDPAEYFRACGVLPDNLLSDSVVQALLATVNAPETPDASLVSAEEKPGPTAAPASEAGEHGFYVTFLVDGRYTVRVDAKDLDSAKKEAELDYAEENFGELSAVDSRIIWVEDEDGNCLYEA